MERQICRTFIGELASCTGITLNLILLRFTFKYTPSQMKEYAQIIRLHCLIDILIDIYIIVSLNHPIILDGKMYVLSFSKLSKDYPKLVTTLLHCYYWLVLYMLSVLPIDFIFRYLSICKQKTLTLFQLVLILFFIAFVTAIEGLSVGFFIKIGPSDESKSETFALYDSLDWDSSLEHLKFLVLPLEHPFALFTKRLMIFKLIALYIIIFYTLWQIRKAVKSLTERRNSLGFERTHNHIQRVLVIQALFPIIICFPVIVLIVQDAFGLENLILSDLALMAGVFFMPVKSFATIIAVPHYRRALFSPFTRFCFPSRGNRREDEVIRVSTISQQPKTTAF